MAKSISKGAQKWREVSQKEHKKEYYEALPPAEVPKISQSHCKIYEGQALERLEQQALVAAFWTSLDRV